MRYCLYLFMPPLLLQLMPVNGVGEICCWAVSQMLRARRDWRRRGLVMI